MGRYINLDTHGKNRTKLMRLVAITLRELIQQENVDTKTRDLAAFISLTLKEISKTIDPTVEAWEKRGYWIKADRYRMEWSWTEKMSARLFSAILIEDWAGIAQTTALLAQKLSHVKIPANHRQGAPWTGAWGKLHSLNGSENKD